MAADPPHGAEMIQTPTVRSHRLLRFHVESDPDSHPGLMEIRVGKSTASSLVVRNDGVSQRFLLELHPLGLGRGGGGP